MAFALSALNDPISTWFELDRVNEAVCQNKREVQLSANAIVSIMAHR